MYIELVFLWSLCWREAEEWLGVKTISVQESGMVNMQKKKQMPRKTVVYHKGTTAIEDHMALKVKEDTHNSTHKSEKRTKSRKAQ